MIPHSEVHEHSVSIKSIGSCSSLPSEVIHWHYAAHAYQRAEVPAVQHVTESRGEAPCPPASNTAGRRVDPGASTTTHRVSEPGVVVVRVLRSGGFGV
ncbi:MAG: hypothetical protein JKY23_04115 [Nitrospinaceae bacterium]|nr:hypothetical protein [Nitrospinaceae bacterium]